jgi:hypothetical protein
MHVIVPSSSIKVFENWSALHPGYVRIKFAKAAAPRRMEVSVYYKLGIFWPSRIRLNKSITLELAWIRLDPLDFAVVLVSINIKPIILLECIIEFPSFIYSLST